MNIEKDKEILISNLLNSPKYDNFSKINTINTAEINYLYETQINLIIDLYDSHAFLINKFRWTFDKFYGEKKQAQKVITAALSRNFQSLFVMIKLTLEGDFGSARTIMRQTYELLLISKFFGVTENEKNAEKWLRGNDFNLYKTVLKYLKTPNNESLNELWKILCYFNHSTIYSNQALPYWKACENDLEMCLSLIYILICSNYHLCNTVYLEINPYALSLMKSYSKSDLQKSRSDFNLLKNEFKNHVGKQAIKVSYDYSRKWKYE
ncbi:hypothetical protein [Wenyingzhuangia sp. IMCC45467]